MQWNMLEAKNSLSRLVQAALAGEEVIIANNGVPMVRLVRIAPPSAPRRPGAWSGLPAAAPDWDAPETNAALADQLAEDQRP